jgi:hypothetical protein
MDIAGSISLDDEAPSLSSVDEVKEIRTFKAKGRGRKQCGECKIYIGVRTKVCVCGKVFTRQKKKTEAVTTTVRRTRKTGVNPPAEKKSAPDYSGGLSRVYAPAGKCPFDLESTEFDAVREWSGKVRESGEAKRNFYTVNALKYYVRYYYGVFTDEYKVVAEHLEKIYESEISVENTTSEEN